MPTLSIIIVNYNGKHFLSDCLSSIKQHVSCSHEIILVDNASSDNSCDFIQKNFPEVTLIASPTNTGFTGGNNIGAKYAHGEFLLLLNNDTVLKTDIVAAIDQFRDSTLGALGCRLVYGDGSFQPSYGYEHKPLRLILFWSGLGDLAKSIKFLNLSENNDQLYLSTHPSVAWVSGAFLLTRRSIWEQLSGLDETYFMYVEDVDYCKRVNALGYRTSYFPDVKIVHFGGGGRPWLGARGLHNTTRSYLIFMDKFYSRTEKLLLRLGLGIVFGIRATMYGFLALTKNSSVYKEKSVGFYSAVGLLLGKNK